MISFRTKITTFSICFEEIICIYEKVKQCSKAERNNKSNKNKRKNLEYSAAGVALFLKSKSQKEIVIS